MIFRIRFVLLGICCLGSLPIARANAQEQTPDDVIVLRELRYREGPSRSWTLDLAMPKVDAGPPRAAGKTSVSPNLS